MEAGPFNVHHHLSCACKVLGLIFVNVTRLLHVASIRSYSIKQSACSAGQQKSDSAHSDVTEVAKNIEVAQIQMLQSSLEQGKGRQCLQACNDAFLGQDLVTTSVRTKNEVAVLIL